jgi:hypothetical protein
MDDKVMREFIPWRRDYYANVKKLPKNAKLHPADRTIQFDMMIGKAIVRWALSRGTVANSRPSQRLSLRKRSGSDQPLSFRSLGSFGGYYAGESKQLGTSGPEKAESYCDTMSL